MKNFSTLISTSRNKAVSPLFLAICLAGASYSSANSEYVAVGSIQCDDQVPANDNDISVFSEKTNGLFGWSHIGDHPEQFTGLKFLKDGDASKYLVGSTAIQADEDCSGDVFKTILVKKYANWDQQHANGLGHDFSSKPTYGQFKDIVLDIKLNSDETYINHEEYLSTYGQFLSKDDLESVDTGLVNIGIEFIGGTLPNDASKKLNGKVVVELDQTHMSDEWLRLVIPVEAVNFFTQEAGGYTVYESNVDVTKYPEIEISGIRINPETHNGKVLRNKLDNYESLNITESYKEEGVSIHNLVFRLKDEESDDKGPIVTPPPGDELDPIDTPPIDDKDPVDEPPEDDKEPVKDKDDSPMKPVFINMLPTCEDIEEFNAFTIYNQQHDHLSNDDSHWDEGRFETRSWSSIYDNWDATSAMTFHSSKDDYNVKLASVQADNECPDLKVMKTVLVKKYANWSGQHMSGLDYRFPAADLTFGDLRDVTLELKINSETTSIPAHEDVVNAYKEFVDEATLEALDQSKYNLTILLFGEAFDDQSKETLIGSLTLDLDQNSETLKDQWLRITIPANSLNYVTQLDWANTDRSLEDYLATNLVGFKIHPETLNTKVIRNYNNVDDFETKVPEMYKEMGVSIRKAVFHLNGEYIEQDDQPDSNQDDSAKDDTADKPTDSATPKDEVTSVTSDDDSGSLGLGLLATLPVLLGLRNRQR